jgi:hypothetical protein
MFEYLIHVSDYSGIAQWTGQEFAPTCEVYNWLNESIGTENWKYVYKYRREDINKFLTGNISYIDYIKTLNQKDTETGIYFYFKTEEDLSLFIIRWVSKKSEEIFWHPV